jgi:hypothetical protein
MSRESGQVVAREAVARVDEPLLALGVVELAAVA